MLTKLGTLLFWVVIGICLYFYYIGIPLLIFMGFLMIFFPRLRNPFELIVGSLIVGGVGILAFVIFGLIGMIFGIGIITGPIGALYAMVMAMNWICGDSRGHALNFTTPYHRNRKD